jgi:hypothetical protein
MKWRKSSYSCSNGNCVEVAADNGVHVRDSKLGDGSPILSFSTDSWEQFVTAAIDGQFDR